MTKIFSGAAEHTAFFLFFLFLWIVGAILAARFLGTYVRPVSSSAGAALEAV